MESSRIMDRVAWLVGAVLAGALVGSPGFVQGQGRYVQIEITQPANEETVHDNEGNVAVQVAVSPDLAPGDRVVVLLDGQPAGEKEDTTLTLSGVERGPHTLEARIVAKSGAMLVASEPVTFYMWQASRLFPSRK
jgi:hypothetical protein